MTFLAEASELLASSLDYNHTLRQVAQLSVPGLADWCAIDMVGPDGEIERLAVAHEDPDKVRWAYELQERYPPDPDAPTGVPQVLRTGEPEFFPELPQELLDEAIGDDEELRRIIDELGLKSTICVPLIARGRTLGRADADRGRDAPAVHARPTSSWRSSSRAAPRSRSTTHASTARPSAAPTRRGRSPTSPTASSCSTRDGRRAPLEPGGRRDHRRRRGRRARSPGRRRRAGLGRRSPRTCRWFRPAAPRGR